jgi:3-carboxy-cis,cis-muconate cycloisomerase
LSITSLDHPYLSALLGDEELAHCFKADWHLNSMLEFEIALAEAEAEAGLIPKAAPKAIAAAVSHLQLSYDRVREGVLRDGVAVPVLVEELRRAVGEPHAKHVHFGATSQDVVDTVQSLCIKRTLPIFDKRLAGLVESLDALNDRDGGIEVMAHTRMQAAIPVTASRKILSWRDPLARHRDRLKSLKRNLPVLHFGGAAGTLDKLGKKGPQVRKLLARRLGLKEVERPLHNERDTLVEFASWMALVTGSLGKMGQDVALMAQNEIGEVTLSSVGGSSAMPHKRNPVAAEMLVTLARFTATLAAGMQHALVHENERSGTAWTLEWMLMPQIAISSGAAMKRASELVGSLSFQGRKK